MTFLVETMKANVNIRDIEGRTPLFSVFNAPDLGKFLLSKGADVFITDDSGLTVLRLCMEYGENWIIKEFQELGGELAILNDTRRVAEYFRALILGGFAARAEMFVDRGHIQVTSELATQLMEEAKGNFDRMKDPVETVELLLRLGASC